MAQARGPYPGRKRSLTAQAGDLRARVAAGEPKAALAREYGISRQTLYEYLRLAEPASPTGPGMTRWPMMLTLLLFATTAFTSCGR